MKTLLLTLVIAGFCSAEVIDRVALVVGKTVFTQSEVDDEVRLSELESGKPLDLSPARRKEAADRLVDQQLLRDEMTATGFQPTAGAVEADASLRHFRQEHFASVALYSAALARYGVTEEALKQHLLWEVTLIRFTDRRFRPFAAAADSQNANRSDNSAPTAAGAAAQTANPANAQATDQATDQAMDAWLKQQRTATRIVFKQEAFQ